MSHPTGFGHALWDAARTLFRGLRRAFAGADEPGGPALVVDESVPALERALGGRYFAPNWLLSYYERGEDLNLARVTFDRRSVDGHEYVWWQTHVRGWRQADGSVRLRAHYELEPTEYDQDHLDGVGLDAGAGTDRLAAALDAAGVAYERHPDLPPGGGDAATAGDDGRWPDRPPAAPSGVDSLDGTPRSPGPLVSLIAISG